jgi:hypothetical protein
MVLKSIKIILSIIVTINSALSQEGDKINLIEFDFQSTVYEKMATDSVKTLYNRQKEYYFKNKEAIHESIYNKAISLNYPLDELDFHIIPKYRLYRDAEKKFNCKSYIENFIVFNEPNKYLKVLIKAKDNFIGVVDVPNYIFEYQRIYTPDVFTIHLRTQYVTSYLNEFVFTNMSKYKIIQERKENFFFELYGLDNIIFEIDKNSGLLYANYFGMFIDEEVVPRMLANEFIRKYIGEKIIIELAKGNYKDIDDFGSIIEFEPCNEINKNFSNPITLKVIHFK